MTKSSTQLALVGMACLLSAANALATDISAAGATFPNPIYSRWFSEYQKAHPDVKINYQSIGSGGGIRQLTEGTVDFGASDKPMSDEELAKVKTKVLHFPTVLGAVVPTYNVPGVATDLKFTGQVLADIFLGKTKKWNDAALTKINPGVKLPDADIQVVHRSDGSGTTFVFTDFLSKASPDWGKGLVGASLDWPVGVGQKGNDGVAGMVKQTPNSIGYVELIYAVQTKMSYGMVQNAAGKYVKASLKSVTEAAGSVKEMPADFRVSITNAPGDGSYPISSFTWLLIPTKFSDSAKANEIKAFLKWMLTSGQPLASQLDFAPLPKAVVSKEEKQIAQIQ